MVTWGSAYPIYSPRASEKEMGEAKVYSVLVSVKVCQVTDASWEKGGAEAARQWEDTSVQELP